MNDLEKAWGRTIVGATSKIPVKNHDELRDDLHNLGDGYYGVKTDLGKEEIMKKDKALMAKFTALGKALDAFYVEMNRYNWD